MQKNIKLAIPTPCHEKWNSFEKTEQGGFCGSCQKEVIDFTGWSEEQLKSHFKKPSLNTCGRFKQEQLKVYTFEQPSSSKTNWLSFTLVSLLLLFSSRQTSAQTITKCEPTTEEVQPEWTVGRVVHVPNDSCVVLKGNVRYARDSSALAGVNVTFKRTSNKTVTDVDGNFQLTLKSSSASDILVFEFIGLKTGEYPVNKNEINEIRITMIDDETIRLGGTVSIVLGAIESLPWYSPRRWWWGAKRCFRN
ncbi:MAG: carboxypeptidase-like regulatory domain-containing protein [Chryseolinea sp.]